MTARVRMNELAKKFAYRVVRALISPPIDMNIPTGAIADKILDDLHDVQVIVTGEVRDVKRVTLQLTLSGAVAQSILRAAAIPDPPMAETTSYGDLAAGVRTYVATEPCDECESTGYNCLAHRAPDPAPKLCPAHGLHPHVGPTGDPRSCTECPNCATPSPPTELTIPDPGSYALRAGDE